uniref:Tc1-like transposase DDE domain-containing protein n=1 Tax=Bionectria ochroleuca TaxID=29856 RepID=A0A8H7TK96_BIOOC
MASRDIYKRIAAQISYKSEAEASRRLEYAKKALSLRPNPEDWYDVLFSDECYFGYGGQGKARIARKKGSRMEPSNLQERKQPAERDLKRLHSWGAVGYNFKSPLVWYNTGSNNGKITQEVYEREILEPYVGKWIEQGYQFVLEEDSDSGHGPSKSNPVRTWKEEHGLKHFFNCPSSPDLSLIENCWLVPKEYVRKYAH